MIVVSNQNSAVCRSLDLSINEYPPYRVNYKAKADQLLNNLRSVIKVDDGVLIEQAKFSSKDLREAEMIFALIILHGKYSKAEAKKEINRLGYVCVNFHELAAFCSMNAEHEFNTTLLAVDVKNNSRSGSRSAIIRFDKALSKNRLIFTDPDSQMQFRGTSHIVVKNEAVHFIC